jgi:hypothetical protein
MGRFSKAREVVINIHPSEATSLNFLAYLKNRRSLEPYTMVFQMLLCGECYENVYT